jgi:transcriptional regulator with XRE-family HTH domain
VIKTKTKYVKTDILKEERESRGLTYEDMANLMGYNSKSTYMYIENGTTVPTAPVMIKIANIFEKPVGYFFDLEVQEPQAVSATGS